MLFIFYAFQGLDELLECYSALAEREKGVLGLLFEINYFMGFLLTVWIVIKVNIATPKAGFEDLYNWLYYQVVLLFVGLGLMFFVFICFFALHRRHKRSQGLKKKVEEAK